MVSYKLDKIDKLFITFMFVVVTIFSICNCVFASEVENVDITIVDGIDVSGNRNYFSYNTSGHVGYFQLEKGYIYHITKNSGYLGYIVGSESVPSNNVNYDIISSIDVGQTFDYLSFNDNYLIIAFNQNVGNTVITVTREKLADMDGTVDNLVKNVGINQFWSVFEGGIDFVGVVVLVAFGLFLVVLAIRKVSKGKGDY